MGFKNISTFSSSAEQGAEWFSFFHKNGSPATLGAGWFSDLSMAAGTPKYNAYVGTQGEGTPMVGQGNSGIYLPPVPSGSSRHIAEINIGTPSSVFTPTTFFLCDYLHFYPLIDMDSTDVQFMDNTAASLLRYESGNGVRAMLVTTTPQGGTARCDISYTNELGVSGRISTIYTATSNTGNIQSAQNSLAGFSAMNPFIPMANGDKGIRTVDSVVMQSSAGGFTAVVLVRPIAEISLRESNTVAEINYLISKKSLPKVLDGACLNFIYQCGIAAASSVVRGYVKCQWN